MAHSKRSLKRELSTPSKHVIGRFSVFWGAENQPQGLKSGHGGHGQVGVECWVGKTVSHVEIENSPYRRGYTAILYQLMVDGLEMPGVY